ncbi:N-acetylglucosaminyltransferase [Iningainema sp. BLCCT55]|uniref:Peptide O-xylosyltransferase n=1 Tax=Iningainema tapete BLCC-T55 TaxID=2748662 RepID=A0A8J6XV64_9CYAN|nr:N-acetylglucosaminyltransferase [Iningainema tapete BLCC-T55]
MRVCYLIQTYKNPEQIYKLVKVIKKSSPNSYVLISHNYNGCILDQTPIQNLTDVSIIENKIKLRDFSITQAYLDAINWLFYHQIQFDWLVNLSGQDYPTQPLPKIEKFLANTRYDGFIQYFDVLSPQSPWSVKVGCDRYFYQYKSLLPKDLPIEQKLILNPLVWLLNRYQPFFRINTSSAIMFGSKSNWTPFNENFVCYGGSYFTTLSRKCVTYLHILAQTSPSLVNYYKKTLLPDESFVQTALVNNKRFKLCNDNYRYIDFQNSRHGHPQILSCKDYSSLQKENIHFARKFDLSKDQRILELLDERILREKLVFT